MKLLAVVSLFCTVALIRGLPLETEQNNQGAREMRGRIIDGSAASPGQFPWQVALYMGVPNGTAFCGGSLISVDWVLTAAHCVSGTRWITVLLGTTDRGWNSSGHIEIAVSRTAYYHGYDPVTHANDIALLQLASAAPLSDTIKPIDLADSTLGAGVEVTVSGWGKTSDSGKVSVTLNYVALTTIGNEECQETYGDLISSGIVCARGANTQSVCIGDNGGPMVTGIDSSAVQVGVVSFGSDAGCTQGYPTAFTRVSSYRDWIQSIIGF